MYFDADSIHLLYNTKRQPVFRLVPKRYNKKSQTKKQLQQKMNRIENVTENLDRCIKGIATIVRAK